MVAIHEVPYEVDGRRMIGILGLPDGSDRRPGVLIAHEGPGLDDFQKTRPRQLAELGYVAFALDYHGGGKVLERDAMNARLDELFADPLRTRELGRAGLDVLVAEPRTRPTHVAAIGYCFGGVMVLELARMGCDLKAVVGFHAGLQTTRPHDAGNITAKVLVCVGADDPFISVDQRHTFEQEMGAGGVDWRMNLYGGVEHSFTHPFAHRANVPGITYDERADRRSWRAMLDLFDEVFTSA